MRMPPAKLTRRLVFGKILLMRDLLAKSLVVSGLDRAEVVAALYNHAVVRSLAVFELHPSLGREEAQRALESSGGDVKEIYGLDLGLRFRGKSLDVEHYDRLYGVGCAASVIHGLHKAEAGTGDLQGLTMEFPEARDPEQPLPVSAGIILNLKERAAHGGSLEADFFGVMSRRLQSDWLLAGKNLTPAAFGFLMLETLYDIRRGVDSYDNKGGAGSVLAKRGSVVDAMASKLPEIVRSICPSGFAAQAIKYIESAESFKERAG